MNNILTSNSLRVRLILILSTLSLLAWFIATGVEWIKFQKEMNKQFDTQQILFAERLASSNLMQGFHEIIPDYKGGFHQPRVNDDALAFAVFTERGNPIINDGRDGKFIKFNPQKGFTDARVIEYDDEEDEIDLWRIFWLKHNDVYIAVGQEIDYRNDIIWNVMKSKLWGGLFNLPLLVFIIWFVINREFKSLRRLEQEVTHRKPDDTSQLELSQIPQEIQPLVKSLNRYFERTNTMFNRERRFTSDAAHELRSPLTGLRIQTEIAQMTRDEPEAHQRALNNITGSIDRIAQLIEQLLTLSRLESITQLEEQESIDWQALIKSNVDQLYAQAERKGTTIQVEIHAQPQNQQGKSLLLNLVLRNLLDNAIKYTPNDSLVKLKLTNRSLVVEDNGNGVSDEDLIKLGQPFYRPVDRPVQSDTDEKGSGLGISIIQRITELHGFSLQFSRSELGGLKAEIIF